MTATPTLLRDVISIPESVHKGDLVYQLADATDDAAKTASEYVVTDQLVTAFNEATGLVKAAVTQGSSLAAYLHGSFGSGKSNFMGVLQLLLDGNPDVRKIPELAGVVTELDTWRSDHTFLTVPFHLIGNDDLESAVFGQYVRHLAKVHPEAPTPAVFADEPILANADDLRAKMGDDAFFDGLSAADDGAASSGWGSLAAGWTATTYDTARAATAGSPDRVRLVQALMSTWLTSFADNAQATRSGYVNFADGLAAISQHAKGLGYSGVILFLDELILWFLSRLGDTAWVNEQSSKLSLLVEAATETRPVPLVSIIARQRDLRELIGDGVPGAEKTSFADQLDYQEGRFDTIHLDDTNLPVVAHKRLLTPIDDTAAATLQAAFASLSLTETTRKALLGDDGTNDTFALTYPFSPAFMTVLVDVAGALQRTRTGLRVLLDLLVAGRDVLQVGQLVPVGDLYDVIARSEEPFSDALKSAFDQARKIYHERLYPALLDEHHLDPTDAVTRAFTNDDRLIKTLLLAALVPGSAPFKDLTVERLVALNHGVISSPVPGQETPIAVAKLRRLAAQVGELRISSDANNPSVSIVLSGVDTGAILATADSSDNTANRRTLLRELVLGSLGLSVDQLQCTYSLVWKGLRRDVDIHFGNIRDPNDLPDSVFASDGKNWRVIIDFPFDDPGHTPAEDLARIDALRDQGGTTSTLAWLPSFFTASTLDVLGRLVRLNYILANDDRFTQATASLNATARESAKPQLRAMQEATRSQLDQAILAAYGVVKADERTIDTSHSLADHFPSLRPGLTIQPPTQANLRAAFDQVLDQALAHTYPKAPSIEGEVRVADVRAIAGLCVDAVLAPDGRLLVNDTAHRKLLSRIANPLQLGTQSEQAFNLQKTSDRWDQVFIKALSAARASGEDEPTVAVLRQAIDADGAMGLTPQLENLVILVWAQATSHTFRQHGGPVTATVDNLDDHWQVTAQPLPEPAVWDAAYKRLAQVFGVQLTTNTRTGFAVERAGVALTEAVANHRMAVEALIARLETWAGTLGGSLDDASNDRLRTARCAQELLEALEAADGDLAKVEALAAARVEPSALTLGKSIMSAATINDQLDATQQDIVVAAAGRPDGSTLRAKLLAALTADELVTALEPVLAETRTNAVALLAKAGGAPSSPATAATNVPVAPVTPPLLPAPAGTQRWTGTDLDAVRAQIDALTDAVDAAAVDPASITVTIDWEGDLPAPGSEK